MARKAQDEGIEAINRRSGARHCSKDAGRDRRDRGAADLAEDEVIFQILMIPETKKILRKQILIQDEFVLQ